MPQIFLTKFFSLQGIQDYFFQTGNVTVQTEKRIFRKGNGILQKRKLKLDATNFLVQKYFVYFFHSDFWFKYRDIHFLHLDHNQTFISVPVGTYLQLNATMCRFIKYSNPVYSTGKLILYNNPTNILIWLYFRLVYSLKIVKISNILLSQRKQYYLLSEIEQIV